MTARGLPPDDPPGEPELDAQWRDIVARLGDLGPDPADDAGPVGDEPRPARGETAHGAGGAWTGESGPPRRRRDDLPGGRTVRRAGGPRPQDPAEPPTPADSDPRGWSPDPEVVEAEDHFVPPDPGPVLGGDPMLTMAWIAVIAAPMLVLVALVAWRDIPALVLQVAGVGFLAGVGLLLWRMPHDRSADDDDPGAVV